MKPIQTFSIVITSLLFVCFGNAFADGARVSVVKTELLCKSATLSPSIEIFLGSTEKSKEFPKPKFSLNRVIFVEEKPRLITKDIDYLSKSEEKTFKMVFTKEGETKLAKASRGSLGKFLVFIVDKKVGFAPEIKDEKSTNEAQITDPIQTDGKTLFQKMCPKPPVQVYTTPTRAPEPAPTNSNTTTTNSTQTPPLQPVPPTNTEAPKN